MHRGLQTEIGWRIRRVTISTSPKATDLNLAGWSPRPERPRGRAGLPMEARLRFTVNGANGSAIWEIAPDGSGLHPLLTGWNTPPAECCGSWTPDGRYFVFQSSRGEVADIWAMRETGQHLPASEPLTGPVDVWAHQHVCSVAQHRWKSDLCPDDPTARAVGALRREVRRISPALSWCADRAFKERAWTFPATENGLPI